MFTPSKFLSNVICGLVVSPFTGGQLDISVVFTATFSLKSKSRKTFIFGVTTSTTLELKFHNLSIEIGRLSYKWQ